MEKISVAVITFNEEKNIGRCLNSVKNIADEIVVVDSYSTDATRAICQREGVRFIEHAWQGYTDTKNFALEQCQYSLVLSLDADEALSDELKMAILAIKDSRTFDAYTFNRKTNYCGQWILHGGWYPDKKLRLFDKTRGRWAAKEVHEYVRMETGVNVQHLKGDLLHYSFYSISDHLKQIDNFSRLYANALFKKGKKFRWHYLIGKPFVRFFKGYFLKGGFLDGTYGFIIAASSAYAVFLRHARLFELYRNDSIES